MVVKNGRAWAYLMAALLVVSLFPPGGTADGGVRARVKDVTPLGLTKLADQDYDYARDHAKVFPQKRFNATVAVKNLGLAGNNSGQTAVTFEHGTGQAVQQFSDDMEGAGGWTTQDLTNNPLWHIQNRASYAGTRAFWAGDESFQPYTYNNFLEESLTTPNIGLPAASNITLRFWHNYSINQGDGGYVLVRNVGAGGSFVKMDPWSGYPQGSNPLGNSNLLTPIGTSLYNGQSNGWVREMNYTLTANASQTIQLQFWFTSGIGAPNSGWYIDEIQVWNGQTNSQIWLNGAEAGMAGWAATDNIVRGGTAWQQTGSMAHGGAQSWLVGDAVNGYPDGEDSVLVSPALDLTGSNFARLTFWHNYTADKDHDGGYLEGSDNGVNWSFLRPVGGAYPSTIGNFEPTVKRTEGTFAGYAGDSLDWREAVFDLGRFAGKSGVFVRFHFTSDYDGVKGTGWGIDDVQVLKWNIAFGAPSTNQVADIAGGQTVLTTFTNQDFTAAGDHVIRITASATGDGNALNDITYVLVRVQNIFTFILREVSSSDPDCDCFPLQHGHNMTFSFGANNTGNTEDNYTLALTAPQGWRSAFNPVNLSVNPGSETGSSVTIWPDATASLPKTNLTDGSKWGDFTVYIVARSAGNSSFTRSIGINITITNHAPVAALGKSDYGKGDFDKVYVHKSYTFSDASYDPDAETPARTFDFGDGSKAYTNTSDAEHTYITSGNYTLTLTVTDGELSSSATANVTVTNLKPAPSITIKTTANNGSYNAGESINMVAEVVDELISAVTFSWDFGDSTPAESGRDVNHTYLEAGTGTYNVTLTATDSESLAGQVVRPMKINRPPVINLTSPAAGLPQYANETITFEAFSSYDPDGDPLSYLWSLTTGENLSTLSRFSRTFLTGDYIVVLQVRDNRGGMSEMRYNLKVVEKVTNRPTLTSPSFWPTRGNDTDDYYFNVTYTDKDGDAPKTIQVVVQNRSVNMEEADRSDKDVKDGKVYTARLRLSRSRSVTHAFSTSDDGINTVSLDVAGGPVVFGPSTVTLLDGLVTVSFRSSVAGDVTAKRLTSAPATAPTGKTGFVYVELSTAIPKDDIMDISLTINYVNATNFNESSLRLWMLKGSSWEMVSDSAVAAGGDGRGRVYGPLTNFGTFGVFGTLKPKTPTTNGKPPISADNPVVLYGIVGAVVAAAAVGGLVLVMRRRKGAAAQGEAGSTLVPPAAMSREEEEKRLAEERARLVESLQKEREAPATPPPEAEMPPDVKVFKPTEGPQEEIVYKPKVADENEEGERVFRPGGASVVEAPEEPAPAPVEAPEAAPPAPVPEPEPAPTVPPAAPPAVPQAPPPAAPKAPAPAPEQPAQPQPAPSPKKEEKKPATDTLDDIEKLLED